MNPPFVLHLQSFPPSIVSCLLRLFYLGERGFGCDGGSAGEVVAVVVMVAAGEGMGMEVRGGGGNLLDHIPVQLWRLVQAGGGNRGGGQSRIIIALQGIMNGLLFGGLLCPHLVAGQERNTGRETEKQRDKDQISDFYL